VFPLGWALLI